MRPITLFSALLAAVLSLAAVPASGQQAGQVSDDQVVIRQTVPSPQVARRAPLTSDQLSTTSTRLIDARRGYRPYDTVFTDRCSRVIAPRYTAYDDHFGVTTAGNRPFSYAARRAQTSVTAYGKSAGAADADSRAQAPVPARPIVVVIRDERPRDPAADIKQPAPDMHVRIHQGEPVLPTRSGAVIVTADGTVICVGD